MRWDIYPLTGLGPITIGMGRADVAHVLDPIAAVTAFNKEFDGSEREFRGVAMPVTSYRDGKVIGVDTNWQLQDVYFQDLNVYTAPSVDVLKRLETAAGGAVEAAGLIIFQGLGISCTGYFLSKEHRLFRPGIGDQDERGMGVFKKDSFAPYASMFTDISFLSM